MNQGVVVLFAATLALEGSMEKDRESLYLDGSSARSLRDEVFNRPEAQDRAVEGRRKHVEGRRRESAQMVFAIRLPPPSTGFGWEIRRFGSIVLGRSETEYPTSAEAKAAGEAAMVAGAAER